MQPHLCPSVYDMFAWALGDSEGIVFCRPSRFRAGRGLRQGLYLSALALRVCGLRYGIQSS